MLGHTSRIYARSTNRKGNEDMDTLPERQARKIIFRRSYRFLCKYALYLYLINKIVKQMRSTNTSEAKLLAAAEKLFMEKGYAATRTTEIAAEAGVTHAMLHYYFHTKEKLFQKVLERKSVFIREFISSSVFNRAVSLESKIRSIVEAQFDIMAANPKLPRFIINEMITPNGGSASVLKYLHGVLPDMLEELQKEYDAEFAAGKIKQVKAFDIFFDIMSLNAFVFISYPVSAQIGALYYENENEFLAARKKESVELILNRIRK